MNGNNMSVDPETGFLTPTNQYSLTGFTAEKKKKFVSHLRKEYNIGRSAKLAGISYYAYVDHMQVDPVFKQAVKEALECHLDDAESKMISNAKTDRGTADRIFLLKNRRKSIYGDRVNLSVEKPEILDALMEKIRANSIDVEVVESAPKEVREVDVKGGEDFSSASSAADSSEPYLQAESAPVNSSPLSSPPDQFNSSQIES